MTEIIKGGRKSIVCAFSNHAPIRFWGEFDDEEVTEQSKHNYRSWQKIDNYVSTLWDARRDFGWHTIDYYTCKSGKRIYYASYNSGETYGGRGPRTATTYLKDAQAIKEYFSEIDQIDEWYRVCGKVDPALIVDSDLL